MDNFISKLQSEYSKYINKKVAIYGSGNHTKLLLEKITPLNLNIVGIIDDISEVTMDSKFGYNIYKVKDIIDKIDTIIISSDVYQEVIYDRIKYLEQYGIDILKIYNSENIYSDIQRRWYKQVNLQKELCGNNEILLNALGDDYLDNKIFESKFYNLCKLDKNRTLLLKEEFEKYGYNLITIDKGNPIKAKCIIFYDIPINNLFYNFCIENKLQEKMVLCLFEPDVVTPHNFDKKYHDNFKVIFTWNDDLVDNKKYFKFFESRPIGIKNNIIKKFTEKKFCVLIAGNKTSNIKGELYSERIKAIRYFEENHLNEFDLYGRGWNSSKYKSYKGEIENKLDILSNYKFSICYENVKDIKGIISEKIFDCFVSGCVPVFWGAENIVDYVWSNTFIDTRNFKSYDELYNYLKSIDELKYKEYINNISLYLKSDEYKLFSDENFTNIITSTLKSQGLI